MAARKVTFSIPEDLARRFFRQVPSRVRSSYLSRLLERSLSERDANLVRACELANEDPEVRTIEREFDALADRIEEPWSDSPAR